jgi:hypothetical protein
VATSYAKTSAREVPTLSVGLTIAIHAAGFALSVTTLQEFGPLDVRVIQKSRILIYPAEEKDFLQ